MSANRISRLPRQCRPRKTAWMSNGVKRLVGWAAIYAIALQTILPGLVPFAGFGSDLAGSQLVICRSDDRSPTSNIAARGSDDHNRGNSCDHCTLCSMPAPPTVQIIVFGNLVVFCLALVLRPAFSAPRAIHVFGFRLARGPPQTVPT